MHWRLPILSFLVVLFLGLSAHARPVQVVDDRQYTLGMVIINTPRVNDAYNAPGNLPISLDVGGNGNIQPGSSDTRFASIQLYLINRPNRVNITISGANAGVVDQEPGSTVKHVTYNLPNCLPAGPYELTLYETGVYENTPYFTITTVPIELRSSAPSGPNASFSCVSPAVTALIAGVQPDRPLPFPPWAPGAARRPPIQKQEEGDDGPDDDPDPTTTANANPQPLPTGTSTSDQASASQSNNSSTASSTQSTGGPTSESTNGPTPNPTTPEPGEATQDGGTRDGQSGTTDNQTDPTQPLDTPIPEQMPVIASGGFIVPVAAEESAARALRRPRIGLGCTAFLLSFALVLL